MNFSLTEIFSTFMVLFAVIDILGSIPIIIDIKSKAGDIDAMKATLAAFAMLLLFFFIGEPLLGIFGVDISSFAIAGAFVLFFIGLEMVLGIQFFKSETAASVSIVPIAFPLVAGAGSFTALLALKAEYHTENILIALTLNMVIVFVALRLTKRLEKWLGKGGIMILRKFFGVILLAIAIKLFTTNTGIHLGKF
jgi:multiple antibiotic resistance protein